MIRCYTTRRHSCALTPAPARKHWDCANGRWMTSILAVCWTACPIHRERLNAEYERTFGLLVSGACPPYETEYVDSKFTFQRSNSLADISGYYQAFGLAISDQHPERPDHVVLELEFVAHLLGLERQAAVEDSDRRAEHLQVCRDAQARFLGEHLAWWTPAFAKLLGCANQNGFYAAAGVFLAALIPAGRPAQAAPSITSRRAQRGGKTRTL
ncbi:MAG: molecular chaperone TorD family protein [Verrucomicrobiota bacterium]